MKTNNELRVRRSIQDLQDDYAKGNKKPLENLMRAWKGIKELPPDNPQSFFMLGGYHGEPFRGAGWGNSSYWGGYCNHGNILFPTWHRVYLLKLEDALRSIPGCEDVILPYWDETSDDSLKNGIPSALTQKDFELDGVKIDNPLRSFVFNKNIKDSINGDNPNYSKPKGYETKRYPLSGLVGDDVDIANTKEHNAKYPNYDENVKLLNQNVVNWLTSQIVVDGKTISNNLKDKYTACLDAPNYTVFSNTTSAGQWNADLDKGIVPFVPLESPHNSIHLAVGGFDVPGIFDASPIEGANGDMGENDTAGLDPIFYFHHCFIDRVFWLWQQKHGYTDHLEVIAEYPGTNSVDNQGPTPGTVPNSWLTLESPLNPFKKKEHGKERVYTSLDCINIEKQLGYTYSHGSLSEQPERAALQPDRSTKVIRVSGINRAPIRGSFLVSAYVNIGGKKYHVGTEAVLSRWSVQYCANCQTHLEVKAFIGLHGFREESLDNAKYEIEIRTRDGLLNQHQPQPQAFSTIEKKLFHLEVR
ncbi:tyrosinase family protein [Nostoc sp.]|uniref:tyrosinase family protein n=1 Tax=Nostoc sp. TaxID=1180 RepID=UPI002FF7AA3D